MSLRPLCLLTLPLLATLLAPRDASACSPLSGFEIERAYPGPDAIDVPVDGVVMVVGVGAFNPGVQVVVKQGDVEVAGAVERLDDDHYRWRSDAPLLPDTTYTLHVASPDADVPDEFDSSFTTGAATAPAPDPAALANVAPEAWAFEIEECVVMGDAGECGQCREWEVVDVEQRMRLLVTVAAPTGPFVGFYRSNVLVGPSAAALESGSELFQGVSGNVQHTIDLGLAGAWPGDEVCVRSDIVDPLGVVAAGEVSCIDIGELNVEPVDETTGGSDSSDSAPTSGGDSGDSGDSEDSGDLGEDTAGQKDDAGCGCRSTTAPHGSAALLLGLGLLLRPRRRAR